MDMTSLVQSYGYLAVALGTFIEGETVLLAAAALAFHGDLSLPLVMVVAAIGGALGDQTCFFLGRRYGSKLLARYPSLMPRAARVSKLLESYQVPLIMGIRFMYGVRILGPMVIGMSAVRLPQFFMLNLAGAIVWAVLIGGIGYEIAQGVASLFANAGADKLGIVAVLLVVLAVCWWARHIRGVSQAWHQ